MLETLLRPNDTAERCGLLLANGDIVEVQNLAENPEAGYEMDPVAALTHIDDAVATWHTHPGGPSNLSGADYQGFLSWPNLEHIIISPDGIKRYRVKDGVVV